MAFIFFLRVWRLPSKGSRIAPSVCFPKRAAPARPQERREQFHRALSRVESKVLKTRVVGGQGKRELVLLAGPPSP